MCSSVSDPHVCFSSGGADRQQCVRLHPPSGPRRDGRAAGNQAAPEGRGRLPHDSRERFQLRVHLLPGWYPWTRYYQFIERELREVIYKEIIFVKFFFLLSSTAPSSPHSPADEPPDRGFFIRMKSTLTKRGLHVKSSGYKVRSFVMIWKKTFFIIHTFPIYLLVPGRIK